MDPWQKTVVIVSVLTFLRLVYHDIKEYIAKRKKEKEEELAKQKKHLRSGKRKRK
ncbi:hypothetical protein [Paenibacillus sp. USHLN196]|uniref:hypothetical protein n=1 Tax=Paenibacillus sp. USHLN196 TaxID=3081291 RepID=UPI0030175AE6